MFDRRGILRLFAALPLAQYAPPSPRQSVAQMPAQIAPPPRPRVVPMEFIIRYQLRPTQQPYGPFLYGDDGQAYDMDEVMRAIFIMTREHWQPMRK